MPLLNYTTSIAVSKSVSEITQKLVKAGARGIAQGYDADGHLVSLEFTIALRGEMFHYVLPARPDAVQKVLTRQRVERRYTTLDHAERVAWRILRDWVGAQMAIIETEMVKLEQIMLPYMTTEDGTTVFERFESQRALIS